MILFILLACSDVEKHDHDHDHENEVITTVVATFTSTAEELVYTWSDVEQDGEPEIDDIILTNETDYTLTLQFLNGLEDPPEDLTEEISDEMEEHQIFFTGSAFDELLQYTYLDADGNSLPVGMEGKVQALQQGDGALTITLRHMPEENGTPIKVEGLSEQVASEGFGGVGGSSDVMVTFPVSVE